MYLFIQLYLYNLCYVYILPWYVQENMFCNTYLTKFMFIRTLLIHDPFGSFHLIIVQTHFVLLYFTLFCFTNIAFEGLWQPWVKQVYQRHFSDIVCSLHVSVLHCSKSRNISNFVIIIFIMVTCDR